MNNIKLQPKNITLFTQNSSLQLEQRFILIPEEFKHEKPVITKIVKPKLKPKPKQPKIVKPVFEDTSASLF